MLHVRTLGDASVTLAGERRVGLIDDADAFALLVHLLLDGPSPRAALLALVRADTADRGEADAARSLAGLLDTIRRCLGDDAIVETEEGIAVGDLEARTDAARFIEAVERADHDAARREYRGPFLADLPPLRHGRLQRWRDTKARRLADIAARIPHVGGAEAVGRPHAATVADAPPGGPRSGRAWLPSPMDRFTDRLRGRFAFQAAAVYTMVAWVALQVVDMLVDHGMLADVYFQAALVVAILGFVLVLAIGWIQEREAVGVGGAPSIPGPWPRWVRRPRRRQIIGVLLGALVVLLATFVALRRLIPEAPVPPLTPGPGSIAVLFFDDNSPNQSLGPLAAGFTEILIEDLASVPTLDVRPVTAVKPFRDGDAPLDSIFAWLDVGALVEGSLTGSGDSVIARVRLQALRDGAPRVLQTASVSGVAGDELVMGADLAWEVARLLREGLGVEIRAHEIQLGSESSEAWLLVQRALELRDAADTLAGDDRAAATRLLGRADSLLQRAEREDPDWNEPIIQRGWTAEARARAEAEFAGSYSEAWAREALLYADRALGRHAGDADALELRGRLSYGLAEVAPAEETNALLRAAERDLRAALREDPGLPRAAWALSQLYHRLGEFEQAEHYAQRALDTDHFYEEAPQIVFQLYTAANDRRDREAADGHCSEGRRRWPDRGYFYVCGLLVLKSYPADSTDVTRAWELHDELVRHSAADDRDNNRRYGLMLVAGVAARAGLPDSARALIARARAPEPLPIFAYDEAHAWLLLGQPDRALARLEDFVAIRPASRESLPTDWWFEELHQDPRFLRLTGTSGEG